MLFAYPSSPLLSLPNKLFTTNTHPPPFSLAEAGFCWWPASGAQTPPLFSKLFPVAHHQFLQVQSGQDRILLLGSIRPKKSKHNKSPLKPFAIPLLTSFRRAFLPLKGEVPQRLKMVSKEATTPEVLNSLIGPSEAEPAEVHVLAVDDSVIDRRVIERLLKTSAYKVTAVDSGRRALEILGIAEALGPVSLNVSPDSCISSADIKSCKQAFQVNLIITDYCMPGMTGYDLLKKIKGTSALKEIPVVIMSSENVPTRISSCLAEGAEEFLLKPVQLADVKRLRGHVRLCGSIPNNQPDANCSKRKAPVDDVLQSPQKRVCINSVTAP